MLITHKQIRPAEVLLDNMLDQEVQKMFYPLHVVTNLFFSSKYFLQDNFVTPHGKKYYVVAFLAQFTFIYCTLYRVYFKIVGFGKGVEKSYGDLIMKIGFNVLNCLGLTSIVYLNVYYREINTQFILRIQSINRCIKIRERIKCISFWNWFSECAIISTDLIAYAIFYSVAKFSSFSFICDIIYITFDVNLIYGIRCIILLRIYLDKWNDSVSKLDVNENFNKTDFQRLFNGYKHVIEAYILYKTIFQAVIAYHLIDSFFRTLMYVEIIIQMCQTPDSELVDQMDSYQVIGILSVVWFSKDLLLMFVQCFETDKFYKATEEAKSLCVLRTRSGTFSDIEKSFCKKVFQTDRVLVSKFNACGLFDIDAVLPLQMAVLLANYVIILLQFAFP